jgi:hypothetical protein
MEETHEPRRSAGWESGSPAVSERPGGDVDVIERTPDADELDSPRETAARDALKVLALEQRIQRLEEAVARLQDTAPIEARVAERITTQITSQFNQNRGPSIRETTGLIVDAGRRLLPAALGAVQDQAPARDPSATGNKQSFWRRWFLVDLLVELRAIFWMFVDPRYRLGWPTRIVALVLLTAIATSRLWPPASLLAPVSDTLTTLVDKVVDLVLAYLLWKILSHEAHRYRQTAPDLPPTMRL